MVLCQPGKGGPRELQHAGRSGGDRGELPASHHQQREASEAGALAAVAEIAADRPAVVSGIEKS